MIAIEYDKRGKERMGKMPIDKREGQNSIFFFSFFFFYTGHQNNIWKRKGFSLHRVGWRMQCQRFDYQAVYFIKCVVLRKHYEPMKVYLHTDSVTVFHLFSSLWSSYSIFSL